MSANSRKDEIVYDLSDIAQELENIGSELLSNFDNVGNDQCSACIYDIAWNIRETVKSISVVDLSKINSSDD